MRTNPLPHSPDVGGSKDKSQLPAFTLVELLVVIVIVIVLATLTFSVSQSARRSAIKVSDMSNLRSLATATMAAGADSAGRFPSIHPAHPLPYYLKGRDILESYGIFKESCYNSNPRMIGGAPAYSFWFRDAGQTPIHYCYFAKDEPTGPSWFQRGSVTPPSRSEYRGRIPYDEIIRDSSKAFARGPNDDVWYPVLWAGICREWSGSQLAALMKDGVALGVNVMYIDGSAKWVDKQQMEHRYTAIGTKVYW